MKTFRIFQLAAILVLATLAVAWIFGVSDFTTLTQHAGKIILALVVVFIAAFSFNHISKLGKKETQDSSNHQGPKF